MIWNKSYNLLQHSWLTYLVNLINHLSLALPYCRPTSSVPVVPGRGSLNAEVGSTAYADMSLVAATGQSTTTTLTTTTTTTTAIASATVTTTVVTKTAAIIPGRRGMSDQWQLDDSETSQMNTTYQTPCWVRAPPAWLESASNDHWVPSTQSRPSTRQKRQVTTSCAKYTR